MFYPTSSTSTIDKNLLETVTPFDIKNAIALLKSNKCSDPNNIFAEHFIHANSENLYKRLSDCFNHIIKPNSLSISTIIPLVKSYKKSLSDPNRGFQLNTDTDKTLRTFNHC